MEDGLPSSEVYFALKDSKHFMWFATDRGLARFDGKKFENYTTKDGLPGNVIFHLQEDSKGRVWFDTYSGKLGYFEEGRFHLFKYNHLIQEHFNTPTITKFYVDSAENVFLSMDKIGLVIIDSKGGIEVKNSDHRIFIEQINEEHFFGSSGNHDGYFSLLLNTKARSEEHLFVNVWDKTEKRSTLNASIKSGTYLENEEAYLFTIKNTLFRVDANGVSVVRKFQYDILNLVSKNNKVYVGFYKNGLLIFSEDNFQDPIGAAVNNYSVSHIYIENKEIWLTTLDDGVHYIPNENSKFYSNQFGLPANHVTAIGTGKSEVLIGDALGNIIVMKNGFTVHKDCKGAVINGIQYNPNYDQFIITGLSLHSYKDEKISQYSMGHQFDAQLSGNELLLYMKPRTIINPEILKNYSIDFIVPKERDYGFLNQKRRVISNFIKYKDSIYIGSIDGLFIERGDALYNLKVRTEMLGTRVIDQAIWDENLLIATRGKGLIVFNSDTIFNIEKKDGLISDQLTCLYVDRQKRIWVGSSEGASMIHQGKIVNFDVSDGIVSNEITCIGANNEHVFFGTKKGLSVIPNEDFDKKKMEVPIVCKSISTNDSVFDGTTVNLPYSANKSFFEIAFVGISYIKTKEVFYRYQLSSQGVNENDWIYTTNSEIVFSNLESGKHTLVIQASYDEVHWSKKPLEVNINVDFPFWTTLKIVLTSAVVLSLLLWIFVSAYVYRLKAKENSKRKLQSLRMESLNAQMNPHFLFNSLNSIQNYILKNDKKAANSYVSTFAKLIRVTLKRSQELDISLGEELKALKLYTELEQRRCKFPININLKIDSEIDQTKIIIPALLIQPLVENAIWHGLMPKQEEGNILIEIKKIGAQLFFRIEDDGVGRDPSKQKHEDDVSRGTNLTIERITLFSKTRNAKYDFEIKDLVDGKKRTGTRVEFKIPYIQKI